MFGYLSFAQLLVFKKTLKERVSQGFLKIPPLPNALGWLVTGSGPFGWGEDRVPSRDGQAASAQASFPHDAKVEG